MNRCVFLDRDGTLNCDPSYLNDPDKLELLEGIAPPLKRLKQNGFKLIVISNQSGIGRGYIKESVLKDINSRLVTMLDEKGVRIDAVYYCPHYKNAAEAEYRKDCGCRKPAPGMLFAAAKEHDIILKESFIIGDMESDIGAGKNAGLSGSILVLTGKGADTFQRKAEWKYVPDLIASDLDAAADWILKKAR